MNETAKGACTGMEGTQRFQKKVAEPHDLSPRARWLREYYFKGNDREWNNQYSPFTTGTPWDRVFNEGDYYIVPEMYPYLGKKSRGPFAKSMELSAERVPLPDNFWTLPLPERRVAFFRAVMLVHLPAEIISDNDLIAGGRFNTQLSKCLNEDEQSRFEKEVLANRDVVFSFHNEGFGNAGAAGGHVIPDYRSIVQHGFKHLHEKATARYEALTNEEKQGHAGAELRAMIASAEIARDVATRYAQECRDLASKATNASRKQELETMAANLDVVPWLPARTFWQGVQAVWLAHMLVIAEESYPGPGLSFGRLDQYLWPLYEADVIWEKTITRDFAKDIFSSFIFHANTAYDAQIKVGRQGITSGFGQLMTLSGCGPAGTDLTNELTYTILDVFDEWAPILEPKPNVRLHKASPDRLLDKIVAMITRSQGAPFILNFDERSIAGMVLEGVPVEDAWDYACVGCLENTMQGNDRSGTVNCNPNLAKSIELVLWNGKSMPGRKKPTKAKYTGPKTGDPASCPSWDAFYEAWKEQVRYIIRRTVEVYNKTEATRARWLPTPFTSIQSKSGDLLKQFVGFTSRLCNDTFDKLPRIFLTDHLR